MKMVAIPIALAHDPIYESAFEVRFALGNPSTAELMPGMLFSALRKHFTASHTLPFHQVPIFVREQDPNLRYQPTHVLEGQGIRLLLGQRVVTVSCSRPYPGWKAMAPRIIECVQAALTTGLTGEPERCSIKYVNLLPENGPQRDLANLKLGLDLAGFTLRPEGVSIRAEVELNGCVSVIEVVGKAKIRLTTAAPPQDAEGLLLAVDTIKNGPFNSFAQSLPQLLETVHATEKQVFFGLLDEQTLKSMGPTYSIQH